MQTFVVPLVFVFAVAFMVWAVLQWRAPRHCPHCGSESVAWTHKSKNDYWWEVFTGHAFWYFSCPDCGHTGRADTIIR